jgi:hypothetical protein
MKMSDPKRYEYSYELRKVVHRVVFSPAMLERWLQHNVEEVGAFENFLPALFAQRERAEFRLEL